MLDDSPRNPAPAQSSVWGPYRSREEWRVPIGGFPNRSAEEAAAGKCGQGPCPYLLHLLRRTKSVGIDGGGGGGGDFEALRIHYRPTARGRHKCTPPLVHVPDRSACDRSVAGCVSCDEGGGNCTQGAAPLLSRLKRAPLGTQVLFRRLRRVIVHGANRWTLRGSQHMTSMRISLATLLQTFLAQSSARSSMSRAPEIRSPVVFPWGSPF